ncbi:hypothetical protein FB567DRAFT_277472 [Paraphoma chrysanthemicola]|uniref:Transmembrane protein n=1 Tax=Paraphoma chrysanthemicola TaxID=798071 RepID=A0A8K0RDF0_9PLEO|nr:hypothetical protein FB567DRAFT_277472 [Paraphoma chrysanthemicola]
MERWKGIVRQFRKGDTLHVEADTTPNPPSNPQESEYGHVGRGPSRVDSYLRPSPSVEPPRIDRFLMYGSPAPLGTSGHPAAIVLQQMPAIPENGNSSVLPLISTATGNAESVTPNESWRPTFLPNSTIPQPPTDVVSEVEMTRHGTTQASTEASDQVEITPPVRRRTPPPAILIEPEAMIQTPRQAPQVNNATWISTSEVSSLVPPLSQKPMASPAAVSTNVSAQSSPVQKAMHTAFWGSGTDASGLAPPVVQNPMSTPLSRTSAEVVGDQIRTNKAATNTKGEIISQGAYDVLRPTCSLNLVCYRGGSEGCITRQVQTALASRFSSEEAFQATIAKNPQLIASDEAFFCELRHLYRDMSGFWRRCLSLKTLRGLRILAFSPERRPVPVPLDDFVLQEVYYAYKHPDSITSNTAWIEWVFRLRKHNKRHALEFVEGWNSTRVVIAAMLPWLISCLVGVSWTASGGDAQTAFTVASFILTSGTVILALLAFISSIESAGRSVSGPG